MRPLWFATLGLVACTSTEPAPPPAVPSPPEPPVVAEPVEPLGDLSTLAGYHWRAANADGSWRLTYHFRADGTYSASGRPAWQEVGKVALLHAEPDRLVLRLHERIFDGHVDEPIERVLTFSADGESFVLNGDRYDRADRVATVALVDEEDEDHVP